MGKDLKDRLVLIKGLTEDQFNLLQPLLEEIHIQREQIIFKQGELAHHLYFVLEGKVAIRFNPEDGPVLTVCEVRQGGVFGWSAAFGSHCYTSSAVCIEPGTCLSLAGEDLKKLYQEDPETGILLLNRLADVIAQRLRGTHQKVVEMLHEWLDHKYSEGRKV